jgi:D-sedoheptulose 7-phosphate isomerase
MGSSLSQWQEAVDVFHATRDHLPALDTVTAATVSVLQAGGAIYACGNGGSAADALHLAEEFTGRYRGNRRPLPALALGGDPASLTCIANDFGFEHVFSRQLEAFSRAGDLVFAFSTSGNSPNILATLDVARARGVTSVLLTGESGGKAAPLADHVLRVPSRNTARIQEVHGFYLHAILEAVETAFPPS